MWGFFPSTNTSDAAAEYGTRPKRFCPGPLSRTSDLQIDTDPRLLEYRIAQKVWLSTKDISPKGITRKLAPRFIGPFPMVLKVVKQSAVHLQLSPSMRIHATFHVSHIKQVTTSSLHSPADLPPPPPLVLLTMSLQSQSDMSWTYYTEAEECGT